MKNVFQIAVCSLLLTSGAGCSTHREIGCCCFPTSPSSEEAVQSGIPGMEFRRLMSEAQDWIADVLPNDPRVAESSSKNVLVVGGTLNQSNAFDGPQSIRDEELTIHTRKLFLNLQKMRNMRDNFEFFDRTSEVEADQVTWTSDMAQYGDRVRYTNDSAEGVFSPNDIYMIKFAFTEVQKLNQDPAKIHLELAVSIEWGGEPGQWLYGNQFESSLVFEKSLFGGKWAAGSEETSQ